MPVDVCRAAAAHLPPGLILDGELLAWDPDRGRTTFSHLRRRITAGRGIEREAARHPAHLVAFDLLRDADGTELLNQPLRARRARLERLMADAPPALTLCPQTDDRETAQTWFTDWTAAGIEGIVAKTDTSRYRPGGHTGWVKVKSRTTTEMVIGGITGTITHPRALLLGRFDQQGRLHHLAQTHPIKPAQRADLAELLRPMPFQGDGGGHPWPRPLPAAWSINLTDRQPLPYVQVEPAVVAEISVDIAVDDPVGRYRHLCTHLRVRPELAAGDVEVLPPRSRQA